MRTLLRADYSVSNGMIQDETISASYCIRRSGRRLMPVREAAQALYWPEGRGRLPAQFSPLGQWFDESGCRFSKA